MICLDSFLFLLSIIYANLKNKKLSVKAIAVRLLFFFLSNYLLIMLSY